MGIEKTGMAFLEYCTNNKILKVLLPISMPIMMVTAIIRFVQNFISIGAVAGVLAYALFILGVLLTFAKSEYKMLSIGFGIYLLNNVYGILETLIRYKFFDWSSLTYLLIWGFFAFMAYKKSIKMNV